MNLMSILEGASDFSKGQSSKYINHAFEDEMIEIDVLVDIMDAGVETDMFARVDLLLIEAAYENENGKLDFTNFTGFGTESLMDKIKESPAKLKVLASKTISAIKSFVKMIVNKIVKLIASGSRKLITMLDKAISYLQRVKDKHDMKKEVMCYVISDKLKELYNHGLKLEKHKIQISLKYSVKSLTEVLSGLLNMELAATTLTVDINSKIPHFINPNATYEQLEETLKDKEFDKFWRDETEFKAELKKISLEKLIVETKAAKELAEGIKRTQRNCTTRLLRSYNFILKNIEDETDKTAATISDDEAKLTVSTLEIFMLLQTKVEKVFPYALRREAAIGKCITHNLKVIADENK